MAEENKPSDTPSSDNKTAQDRGQGSVALSIEEKAMQVMPVTPDPQGSAEMGGLPTSEGGSGGEGGGSEGGGSEGGGSEGGGDSGGGSSSSDAGE